MFKCQECGRKFRTERAASRAVNNGCPGCGSSDIDVDTNPTRRKQRNAKRLRQVLDPILDPPICADCGGYHEYEECPDRVDVEELEAAEEVLSNVRRQYAE